MHRNVYEARSCIPSFNMVIQTCMHVSIHSYQRYEVPGLDGVMRL